MLIHAAREPPGLRRRQHQPPAPGTVLNVPGADAVRAIDAGEARREIRAQAADFDAYRRGLATSVAARAPNPPAAVQESGGRDRAACSGSRRGDRAAGDKVTVSRSDDQADVGRRRACRCWKKNSPRVRRRSRRPTSVLSGSSAAFATSGSACSRCRAAPWASCPGLVHARPPSSVAAAAQPVVTPPVEAAKAPAAPAAVPGPVAESAPAPAPPRPRCRARRPR